MIAPGLALVIVTDCEPEYVPATGIKVGVLAMAFIVYVNVATVESTNPVPPATAFKICEVEMEIGTV